MTLPLLVANTIPYQGAWVPAARLRGEQVRVVVQGTKDGDALQLVVRDNDMYEHKFVMNEGVNVLPIIRKSVKALRIIRQTSSGSEIFVDAE